MPQNGRKKPHINLSPRAFWLWAAVFVLLRCGITLFQQGYIWVGGAPLDDELMFRTANAITNGQWLGAYDDLTLSKSSFFAVWLALLHALHLPYLLGGALLWCGAALLAGFAFAPLWQKKRGVTLAVFGLLAFLPSSWASYTLRIYRDNIFPALCLFCFAGFAGALLRVWRAQKQPPKTALWPWLLAGGLGLASGFLNREDAGAFLLPYAAVCTLLMLVLLAKRRRWPAMLWQALPYGLLCAGALAFCILNYQNYGVFALSDFSSGAFANAMGAMSRVDSAYIPLVAVSEEAREKLYAAVPELAVLRPWLEEDPQMRNDFKDPELGDYRAGSFYWAIRRAAQFEGVYADAKTAAAYWQGVADTINARCDDGTLPARTGERSGTTAPIRAEHILPVLRESVRSLYWTLTFQNCPASEAQRSIGTEADFAQWSGYLHCDFNSAAEAGKDTPYYSPTQKLVFGLLGGVRLLYAAALTLGFALAVFCWARGIFRRRKGEGMVWGLLTLLLFMAALRCGMIAFVEVSSFGIGTSTMYLSTVHPLLLLFTAGSLAHTACKESI